MIYFIACPEAKAVKIGTTTQRHYLTADSSAFQRLYSMQAGCPLALELLAICDGGPIKERELHGRFSHLRMRGEWFHLTDEITQHIAGFHKPIRQPRGWNKRSTAPRQAVAA